MSCPGTAWVVTRYPDGTEVHAHPQHGPGDVARAIALGYPNVEYMTLDHDPLHTLLCQVLTGRPSPVLRAQALRGPTPAGASAEEELVLAAQRWLNERRITLL